MQASLGDQLRAALNQWDREEKQQAQPAAPVYQKTSPFQITNNLNRTAFEEVKAHPAARKQIHDRLIAKGYKTGSVSAVLGHMLRQGVAQVDDEGIMHVTVPEYVPLKSYKTLQNRKKKAAKTKQILVDVQRKKVTIVKKEEKRPVSSSVGGIASIPMRPKDPPPGRPLPWSVREVLEMLDVLQARAVYDELKKIFGDNK